MNFVGFYFLYTISFSFVRCPLFSVQHIKPPYDDWLEQLTFEVEDGVILHFILKTFYWFRSSVMFGRVAESCAQRKIQWIQIRRSGDPFNWTYTSSHINYDSFLDALFIPDFWIKFGGVPKHFLSVSKEESIGFRTGFLAVCSNRLLLPVVLTYIAVKRRIIHSRFLNEICLDSKTLF